jgi:hypothetical protein
MQPPRVPKTPPASEHQISATVSFPPQTYDDVEIHVTPGPGDRYLVTLQTALAGDASDPLDQRWSDKDLTSWLTGLERGSMESSMLYAFGKQLFHALFHDHVRDSYAQARGAAQAGLRLRLWIDAPELQALPWELLYDAGQHEFLALSGKALITRYLSVPQGAPPLGVQPPLGVLIVTASPRDQPSLDVAAEEAAVREALAPLQAEGLVRVASLPHAQVMALRETLRDVQPHILHFVGHGTVERGGGALILEDEEGFSRSLSSSALRTVLQRTDVRLAVLNACLTARDTGVEAISSNARQALLGVGPALVRGGLGAVVAMQFSLSTHAAQLFAQDFYRTLARLEPVDQAVSRAREALMLEFGEDQRNWATPVLFLRAPDGVIFARRGLSREN